MNCAVLIMSSGKEPSLRNVSMMKETFIMDTLRKIKEGKMIHNYKFYIYNYDETIIKPVIDIDSDGIIDGNPHIFNVRFNGKDTVYRTFEKTVDMFSIIAGSGYDWYVRINISNFLNMDLLDNVLSSCKKDKIYCNAVNSISNMDNYFNVFYARGDFMIISDSRIKNILNASPRFYESDIRDQGRDNVVHTDDTLLGLCFFHSIESEQDDPFGYIDFIEQLKYAFLPQQKLSDEIVKGIDFTHTISFRVKTVPPEVNYSGYSWNDNEYRKIDPEKMKLIHEKIKDIDRNTLPTSIEDLYVKPDNERYIIVVEPTQIKLSDIKNRKK